MGALPPNPHENNKDSNPPCCPRSANNREGRKKGEEWGLFAPKPLTRMLVGRNGVTARRYRFYKLPTLRLFASPSHCSWSLDPISLADRTPDTMVPGQLRILLTTLSPG